MLKKIGLGGEDSLSFYASRKRLERSRKGSVTIKGGKREINLGLHLPKP